MNELGRILIVEDDPKDVELTLTALEEYNLANEVVITRDGEEALDYLYCRGKFTTRTNDNPAVLLLDLKLPKVDGLEVLQQIKSDEKLRMIPVVVLTSSREERDMVASYKLGVNAYVVKPVDFHEFVNAIKELGIFWAVINEPRQLSGKRHHVHSGRAFSQQHGQQFPIAQRRCALAEQFFSRAVVFGNLERMTRARLAWSSS